MKENTLVKYTGNVNDPFDPNLIDNLQVKSFFNDSFGKSEYWGWNDEGENEHPYFDFGTLGGFIDFEVSRSSTKLYFAAGVCIGFESTNMNKLIMLDIDEHHFHSAYYPEKTHSKRPDTIKEFIDMTTDFIQFILQELNTKELERILKQEKRYNTKPSVQKTDDCLPF